MDLFDEIKSFYKATWIDSNNVKNILITCKLNLRSNYIPDGVCSHVINPCMSVHLQVRLHNLFIHLTEY